VGSLSNVTGGLLRALTATGLAAYCWFASGLRPFTAPMDAAIAIPVVLMALLVGIGWLHSRTGPSRPLPDVAVTWRTAGPWLGLVGALTVWELSSWLSTPRHDHPTLSSMAQTVVGTHPGRAILMAAWLVLGWVLFLRSRRGGQAVTSR
jgi:hypothetical protein